MNNTVIKATSLEHAKEIIKYFTNMGVFTSHYKGNSVGFCYGVVNGKFGCWSEGELPLDVTKTEISDFPKRMLCWDALESDAVETTVIGMYQDRYVANGNVANSEWVIYKNAKEIKLPQPFPKKMLVWDNEESCAVERTVVGTAGVNQPTYMAIQDEKTYPETGKLTRYIHAKEI